MTQRRTLEEEQEAVTGAVIGIMHILVAIANDASVEAHLRILAASEVLAYARDTEGAVAFDVEDESSDEDEESEGDEPC